MKLLYDSNRGKGALLLLALAGYAAAQNAPVVFNAPLKAGERASVTGSRVTLGSGAVFGEGSLLTVRASESIVFEPGITFAPGTLNLHVGPAPLAKPTALAAPVEAFAASVRAAPGGLMLRYALPEAGRVNLRVLDAQGKTVFKTSLRPQGSGRHEAVVGFAPKRTGLYIVRADFGRASITQRLMLTGR